VDFGRRIGRDPGTGHCLQQSRWDLGRFGGGRRDAARAQAISRIVGGNPPTAAQFNTSNNTTT